MNHLLPLFFLFAASATHAQAEATQASDAVAAAGVGTGLSPAVYVGGTAVAGTLIGLCAANVICHGGDNTKGANAATGTTGSTGTH